MGSVATSTVGICCSQRKLRSRRGRVVFFTGENATPACAGHRRCRRQRRDHCGLRTEVDRTSSLAARHTAARRGLDPKVVGLLLTEGVDDNTKGDAVHTPLHFAPSGGHTADVQTLLSRGADPTKLEEQR